MATVWVKGGSGRRVRLPDGRIVTDAPEAPAVPVAGGDPFTLRRLRDGDLIEAPAPAEPVAEPAAEPAAPAAPAAPREERASGTTVAPKPAVAPATKGAA